MASGTIGRVCVLALLVAASVPVGSDVGTAADLSGSCCADLEERVAELEATTARKGNRKVSLTVSGWVNEALLHWDDGVESGLYQVTNMVAQSRFRFVGSASISPDLSAGYLLEIGVNGARSDSVDQTTDEGASADAVSVRHSAWWLQSRTLGRLWVGQTSQASDGITEINLANTTHFATENAAATSGHYVRNADGTPTSTRLGVFMGGPNIGGSATVDAAQIGEGNRRNLVKYETPTIGGFVASASWGEDDFWDVAVRYAGEAQGFKLAFGIGYEQMRDGPQIAGGATNNERNCAVPLVITDKDVDCSQLGLSGAIMHVPTGLYVHAAYGIRWDDHAKTLWGASADSSSTQLYVQAGIEKNWLGIGNTTVFGEYQDWNIGGTNKWGFAEMTMWGVGLNQSIAAAAMDVYVNYRHYGDLSALIVFGGPIIDFKDFQTVMAGGIIRF